MRIDIDGIVASRWPDAGTQRARLVDDLERAPRWFNPQRACLRTRTIALQCTHTTRAAAHIDTRHSTRTRGV